MKRPDDDKALNIRHAISPDDLLDKLFEMKEENQKRGRRSLYKLGTMTPIEYINRYYQVISLAKRISSLDWINAKITAEKHGSSVNIWLSVT